MSFFKYRQLNNGILIFEFMKNGAEDNKQKITNKNKNINKNINR